MKRRLASLAGLAVASLALLACAPKPHAQIAAPTGRWTPLFNGKDLNGWTIKIAGLELNDNYRNTFRVTNGVLQVSYADYDRFENRFGSIFTNQSFSHYWLHAEYRFVGAQAAGAPSWAYRNSGIQLHSQNPESMGKDQQFPVSVEFDIVGGRSFGRYPTGDVCQNGTKVKIAGVYLKGQCSKLSDISIPGDGWVTLEAEVDGAKRVRQMVNGSLIVEYTDVSLDEGNADARRLIAVGAAPTWESGRISLQANSHPIEFRRIDVMPVEP